MFSGGDHFRGCRTSCRARREDSKVNTMKKKNEPSNGEGEDALVEDNAPLSTEVTGLCQQDGGSEESTWKISPDLKTEDPGPASLLPQVLGTAAAALAQMDIGAMFAYPGVTLPQVLDHTSEDLVFDINQAALFGSVIYLGAMVGSFLAGAPMVRLGQRVTLLMALPLSFASWVTFFAAPYIWLILVARFIHGFALSFIASSSSTYVAELSHSSVRGRLVAVLEICRQLGSLLIYIMGISSLTWRKIALISAFINTMLPFLGLLMLPNSPRWLATRGRTKDAHQALRFFRGPTYNTNKEMDAIVDQLQSSSAKHKSVTQQLRQLRDPSIFRYVVIMSVVLFLMHFNGTSVLPAYIVIIMDMAQVHMSSYVAAIAVCITRLVGNMCYSLVIDHINRKPLFAVSCLICAASMSILGGFFYDRTHDRLFQHQEWLPVFCLAIYSFFSVSPVVSLLRCELFPSTVRSAVVPVLYTTFFMGAFASLQTYPYIVTAVEPYGAFWLFSCCTILLMLIVAFTIPETRGKSLEQITDMQRKSTSKGKRTT